MICSSGCLLLNHLPHCVLVSRPLHPSRGHLQMALPDAQGAPRLRSLRSENAHPVSTSVTRAGHSFWESQVEEQYVRSWRGGWHLADFLRHVYNAGKPAFSRKASSHCKEVLLRLVCPVTFDLADGSAPRLAGHAPFLGDSGHVGCAVLAYKQTEPALRKYTFVIVTWNKQEKTYRTADRDFRICQRPRHCNGIGE
jgi:hypothetical protein